MKLYLIVTGILFGLIAVMHVLHSVAQRDQLTTNPGNYLGMSALGALAAGLSIWAWRLLWLLGSRQAQQPPDREAR